MSHIDFNHLKDSLTKYINVVNLYLNQRYESTLLLLKCVETFQQVSS